MSAKVRWNRLGAFGEGFEDTLRVNCGEEEGKSCYLSHFPSHCWTVATECTQSPFTAQSKLLSKSVNSQRSKSKCHHTLTFNVRLTSQVPKIPMSNPINNEIVFFMQIQTQLERLRHVWGKSEFWRSVNIMPTPKMEPFKLVSITCSFNYNYFTYKLRK